MEFYYYQGQERRGPLSADQLKHLARSGQITPETILESNGKRTVAGTTGLFPAPSTPPPFTPPNPTAPRDRVLEYAGEEFLV